MIIVSLLTIDLFIFYNLCGYFLQSDNDAAYRRAQILSDMHIRTLRAKAKLVQETEKVHKQLEVNYRVFV